MFQAIILCNLKENVEKTNFRPDFGPLWPKFGSQIFFRGFYL